MDPENDRRADAPDLEPIARHPESVSRHADSWVKRVFDIVLTMGGAAVFVVVLPFIALAIKVDSRGPVIYRQDRVGKNGRVFSVLKFRTMVQNAEASSGPIFSPKHDPRITRVGNILRASALDELPQVINILRGDMSLVGPRAERPELHEQFSREIPGYRARVRVRPGLTGLAQTRGAYNQDKKEVTRHDLEYARVSSLFIDSKLVFVSIWNSLTAKWDKKV